MLKVDWFDDIGICDLLKIVRLVGEVEGKEWSNENGIKEAARGLTSEVAKAVKMRVSARIVELKEVIDKQSAGSRLL